MDPHVIQCSVLISLSFSHVSNKRLAISDKHSFQNLPVNKFIALNVNPNNRVGDFKKKKIKNCKVTAVILFNINLSFKVFVVSIKTVIYLSTVTKFRIEILCT